MAATRSRKVSTATQSAMNEIESLLQEPENKERKTSAATKEALSFIDESLGSKDKSLNETRAQSGNTPPQIPPPPKQEKKRRKKKVVPLSAPVIKGRHSIQYVLTAEEREVLFQGRIIEEEEAGGMESTYVDDTTIEGEENEKSALTCVLLLMFEELEHQPLVYEKLFSSDLFDGCLKNVPEEQNKLVRKILKNS